jgi:UDP-N-acetylmuramate: L-alanyl-gamma-D-glutamyl-meso-diaminopimelate ligase
VTASLLPTPWTTVFRIGEARDNDLSLSDFEETQSGSRFTLLWKGRHWADVQTALGGFYNARNVAMAAAAAGLALYPKDPTQLDLTSLSTFQGVKRRQEVLYNAPNIRVLEDFAHHPTAVRDTIISLRKRYPDHRLTICFEPRSNTACSKVFEDTLHEALLEADYTLLGKVHRGEAIPFDQRLDTSRVCQKINELKGAVVAHAHRCNQELLASLLETAREASGPHLICFLSNGSFDGITSSFIKGIQSDDN